MTLEESLEGDTVGYIWGAQRRQDDLKNVMKFLEEKIRDLKAEGSKQTHSPENDPTPARNAAHHQSEVTQQDGLGLGQDSVQVPERRRTL